MKDAYADDLSDFIRNGRLDGYELTDDELAHFLEVWRWSVWMRRNEPTGPDHDILDATQHLQAHMQHDQHVEVEYNTLLLLRQELEPLMMLRVLWDLPKALAYFAHPGRWLELLRSLRRARRYGRTASMTDWRTKRRAYPKLTLEQVRERAPDLLRRKYWSRVGVSSFEAKKHEGAWW